MPNQKHSGHDLIPLLISLFPHFADSAIWVETEKNFKGLKQKIVAAACW